NGDPGMQAEITSGFRLSPQQTHLWTLQQKRMQMPERARCLITIEGELNVQVLHRAVDMVAQRHDVLRLMFQRLPGMTIPLQQLVNVATLSSSVQELSPAKHRLLLTLPALCADERSLQNLAREIGIAYEACVEERELVDQPLQYLVASEWLNELLESEEAA